MGGENEAQDASRVDLLEVGESDASIRPTTKYVSFKRTPFIIVCTILAIGVIIAIFFPVMFMGVAPALAKSAVDKTQVALYNIRITGWDYSCKDYKACTVCEAYHPKFLQLIQDIQFSNIPGIASHGSAQILSTTLDVLYNGTKFGEITLPEIDLSNPKDGVKWANNTNCVMKVTNDAGFIDANHDLLPIVGKGVAVWHQYGNVIMRQTIAGITNYYQALMDQDVRVTSPKFLAGPMQYLNVFEALPCLRAAEEPADATAEAVSATASTAAAKPTSSATVSTSAAAKPTASSATETTEPTVTPSSLASRHG